MTIRRFAASAATLAMLFSANAALAQVSESGMGKVLPVEIYVCSFNDGQDAGDLDKAVEGWTEYMDDQDTNNYSAWTLTPFMFGAEQDFDFLWMGAYTDGNAMGAGIQSWLTEGGEQREAFDKVATCNAHVMLGSAMYKAPSDQQTPASGVITMMDCKLNEGSRYSDIKGAELKWSKYLTENDSAAGYWHWFPTFGGGDADFDYKVVSAYRDFNELGADFEHNANGGGRDTSREIFGDIDECDDRRVYIANSRRNAQLR